MGSSGTQRHSGRTVLIIDEFEYHIRAIAFDLDGTLLDSDRVLTPAVIKAIGLLKARGIVPIIATGRSFRAMAPYQEQLQITAPVICYNGAVVYHGESGEIMHSVLLDDEITREIIRIGRASNLHLHGFRDEQLLFEEDDAEIADYQARVGFSGTRVDFDTLEPLRMTKMMYIAEDPSRIEQAAVMLEEAFGERLHHCFSLPTFYEMIDGSASKEHALQRVLSDLGISPDHTMAFGDGGNDSAMLEAVRIGIAMDNAGDEVKLRSTFCAPGNDEDGVARFLDEFFHLGIFPEDELL